MAGRQHETIAVEPVRIRGVECQVLAKQHCRDIRHAHRHSGVAGTGGLDRVHRQDADRAGQFPVLRVGFAAGFDIHGFPSGGK